MIKPRESIFIKAGNQAPLAKGVRENHGDRELLGESSDVWLCEDKANNPSLLLKTETQNSLLLAELALFSNVPPVITMSER